jgi:P-type Cu+ transporter
MKARADQRRRDSTTVILVAADGAIAGKIANADLIGATTSGALAVFRREGTQVVMLTGIINGLP